MPRSNSEAPLFGKIDSAMSKFDENTFNDVGRSAEFKQNDKTVLSSNTVRPKSVY